MEKKQDLDLGKLPPSKVSLPGKPLLCHLQVRNTPGQHSLSHPTSDS